MKMPLDSFARTPSALTRGAKACAIRLAIVLLFVGIFRQSAAGADDTKSDGNDSPPLVKQISGTVLTTDGKPAADAKVVVLGLPWAGEFFTQDPSFFNEIIAQGQCDQHGRFHLDHLKPTTRSWQQARLIACDKNSALTWVPLDLYEQPLTDLRIQLEGAKELRGRLLMPDGQPAIGFPVKLDVIYNVAGNFDTYLGLNVRDATDLSFPVGFITDSHGEFLVPHLPEHSTIELSVDFPKYLRKQWTWAFDDSQVRDVSLSPAQTVTVAVTAAESGESLSNATVDIYGGNLKIQNEKRVVDTRWSASGQTDSQGKVSLKIPQDANQSEPINVRAVAPYHTAYFGNTLKIDVGADLSKELKAELPRGVSITGRVVEQPGGRPVADAGVSYVPAKNANAKGITFRGMGRPDDITDENGKFIIPAVEGPGTLVVWYASINHVLHPLSQIELHTGKPPPTYDDSSTLVFAHVPINVPANAKVMKVEIPLERGLTAEGTIADADGTIPALSFMTHRGKLRNYTDVLGHDNIWPIYNGNFKIRGIPADGEQLVYFLDATDKQGKILNIKGSDAEHVMKMQLEKCG